MAACPFTGHGKDLLQTRRPEPIPHLCTNRTAGPKQGGSVQLSRLYEVSKLFKLYTLINKNIFEHKPSTFGYLFIYKSYTSNTATTCYIRYKTYNETEIFKRISHCLATSSCTARGYMDPTLETTGPELTTRVMNQFPHRALPSGAYILSSPSTSQMCVTGHTLGAQSKSMGRTGPSGCEPLAATDSRGRLMAGQSLSHTEPPLLRS